MTNSDSPEEPGNEEHRLNAVQRSGLKDLRKAARKGKDEPLTSEDWASYWTLMGSTSRLGWRRLMARLPSNPRCGVCAAPFAGFGSRLVRPLGFAPSRKNPNICAACVEMAPPGGMTTDVGILFIDIRGFTTASEQTTPEQSVKLLQRFYACAEGALFPEALIDKLIGDEVMALYIPEITGHPNTSELMVDHARELLEAIGYGTGTPFVEAGIGLDFGEAFVGNIGDRAVFDFTAIGDVVNSASRLQGEAGGGEIVFSERVASELTDPPGEPVSLELKGKAEPFAARRLRVG